jgi:hypothetical protein
MLKTVESRVPNRRLRRDVTMPIAPADANGEKRGVERKADGGRAPVWKEGHGPVVHLQDEAADVVRLIFVFFNLYAKKNVPRND